MEFFYLYWCLVLMIYMTGAAGKKIELIVQRLGSPDYYVNDTLYLYCETSGYTNISSQRFFVDDSPDAGCNYSSAGWDRMPDGRIKHISEYYCRVTGNRTGFGLLVFYKITPKSVGLQIKCLPEINGVPQLPSNILTISTTLKVAPEGLAFAMKNQNQSVIEGEAFEYECVTTSASDSEYRYDLKRGENIVMEDIGTSYTPDKNDRRGFRIVCEDTIHVNWIGGNTRQQSEIIYPLYFAIEGQRNISLNLISPAPLICNITGNTSITFSWQRESSPLTETSSSIYLKSTNAKDGDLETVSCTATVEGKPDITITWMVTWYDDAPKSIAPGTSFGYELIGMLALVMVFIV